MSRLNPEFFADVLDRRAYVAGYDGIGAAKRERAPEPEPVCPTCEGGGWECYGIGRGDPHFRPCPTCGNPEGLPSP